MSAEIPRKRQGAENKVSRGEESQQWKKLIQEKAQWEGKSTGEQLAEKCDHQIESLVSVYKR